jgi:hypothetical protein
MSLLRLKSDLKSLKYGDFQTKDPLITKDINNPPSNNTLSMQVTRRVDDTIRIVKLLATKPGISFVAKQAALEIVKQNMNSDGKEKILKSLAKAGLNTAKILASTIAQIPVNGTGTHFVRGFAEKEGYLGVSGVEFFGGSKKDLPSDPYKGVISELGNRNSIYSPWNNEGSVFDPSFEPHPLSEEGLLKLDAKTGDNFELENLIRADEIKKEVRINLGDQGKRINRLSYTDTSEDLSDGINKLNPTKDTIKGTEEGRDLIKFRFHVLDSENDEETNIFFRAFLDSFDDSYSGNWNTHNYIGRGENFYTYGGFDREISLSFKIAAATRQEMFPLYRKMVMLASTTAPTYGDGNFMKGTIVGLTVGDYIYKTYGIIKTVNYSWQTDYPWEIAMNNPESIIDDDQQELPMIMDCGVSFTPIHNFVPQTGMYHYITNDRLLNTGKKKVFNENDKFSKFD